MNSSRTPLVPKRARSTQRMPRTAHLPVALLVAAATHAGCGASTQAVDPVPTEAAPTDVPAVSLPPTPAGRALLWALDAVDPAHDLPDVAELSARFSPAFADAIPLETVRTVLEGLRTQTGGLTLQSLEHVDETQIVAVAHDASGAPWRVLVSASAGQPFVVDGLLYRPAPELAMDTPEDWPSLIAAVRDLAPQTALLAARVDGSRCIPVASHMPDLQLPIGSGFKLFVLGTLLDAIDAGEVAWDTVLETSERTVFDAAELMISRSDNPATDELIALIGRERVEQSLAAWGLTQPERNIPFLTTLDLFVLKGTRDGELGQRYLDADVDGRRAILAGIAPEDIGAMRMWTEPRMLDLEWFASANDMCRTMVRLHERADTSELAAATRHVLSLNPGIAIRSEDWLYAGYKGGSEPGVIHLTWLLEDSERQRWFFSMTAVNPDALINDGLAVALAAIGVDLLANE